MNAAFPADHRTNLFDSVYVRVDLLAKYTQRLDHDSGRMIKVFRYWCAVYDHHNEMAEMFTGDHEPAAEFQCIHLHRLTAVEFDAGIKPDQFFGFHASQKKLRIKDLGYTEVFGTWCVDPIERRVINLDSLNDELRSSVKIRDGVGGQWMQGNVPPRAVSITERLGNLSPASGDWLI